MLAFALVVVVALIRRPQQVEEASAATGVRYPTAEDDELFRAFEEALAEETALT